jgi:hypothetical protein
LTDGNAVEKEKAMPEHELFQTYYTGQDVPPTVESAIPGCQWAEPKRVAYDPATNANTYRYTLRVWDRRAYAEHQRRIEEDLT